jgi:hypothetical protein
MSRFELLELLQQDIEDMKGLFTYEKHRLTKIEIRRLAKGIIGNLEDHLEDLIKLKDKKQKPTKKLNNHLFKN